MPDTPEIQAARRLAAELAGALQRAPSFQALDSQARTSLLRDVASIQQAVAAPPARDPYALSLATPQWAERRRGLEQGGGGAGPADGATGNGAGAGQAAPSKRPPATETLATRAGALVDEIDFPAFVAGLVHGTFDAIVDATIRQMEAFADLVSAVAKDVEQFTDENVTPNQARDQLAQRHPGELWVDTSGGGPRLRARQADDEAVSPSWLADYGLAGQDLTDELVEEQLVPAARRSVGENRQQLLATMVLLGMSRVNVKDGRIAARVRFRAAAKDSVALDYAVTQDPGGGTSWGGRGSAAYDNHTTMISTVGVNAQSDTDLKAELFGEVEINFVSETLPLDRFADSARLALLQRNARWSGPLPPGAGGAGAGAAPAPPAPPAAAPPAPAPGPGPAPTPAPAPAPGAQP